MVVAVSILGNPAALDVMRAFCDAHGLYLFEDNCESMGASLNGRPCGTFGDVNTFSTFYSHHISTMEGGLLVTNDTEIASSRASDPQSRLGARRAGRLARSTQAAHDDPFFEAYRFIVPGLQRPAARDLRRRRPRAAQEARRHAGRSAGRTPRISSSCSAATIASSFSARTAELLVQLHDHSEPGARHSTARG